MCLFRPRAQSPGSVCLDLRARSARFRANHDLSDAVRRHIDLACDLARGQAEFLRFLLEDSPGCTARLDMVVASLREVTVRSDRPRHRCCLGGSPCQVGAPGCFSQVVRRRGRKVEQVSGQCVGHQLVPWHSLVPGPLQYRGGEPESLLEQLERTPVLAGEGPSEQVREGRLQPSTAFVDGGVQARRRVRAEPSHPVPDVRHVGVQQRRAQFGGDRGHPPVIL